MDSNYIKAIIIIIAGLVAFGLFIWYFAAEEAKNKRLGGTLLALLVAGFSIYFICTEKLKKGIDLEGGAAFRVQIQPAEGKKVTRVEAESAKEVIEKRLAPLGNKDIVVTVQGEDIIYVEVPGITTEEIDKNREIIEKVAKLEFRLVHPQSQQLIGQRAEGDRVLEPGWIEVPMKEKDLDPETGEAKKPVLNAEDLKLSRDEQAKKRLDDIFKKRQTILVKNTAEMSGKSVKSAFATLQPGGGNFQIVVNLQSEFGSKMESITEKNLHQPMAIMVDGEVISAPTIQGKFGDHFEVTGQFKQKEAIDLASALSNPLENPLKIIQSSQTSPTYGEQVVKQGVTAGLAGMAATLLFMAVYYRLAGIIAVIGLVVNTLILLAAMIVFDFTLTMPGIAGMLLTLGIAVDANVLIYERMREEFRTGKNLHSAINASYSRAFTAIFDSHVTSLITSTIMIAVATGAVKGFGVTLTVGILASLFSALLITRVCFGWLESAGLQKLTFLHLINNRYIDFMSKRKAFIVSSFVLAGLALAVLFVKGKASLGYELRGGELITITGVTETQVAEVLKDIVNVTDKEGKTEAFVKNLQTIKPVNESEYVNLRTNFGQGPAAVEAIKKGLPNAKIGDVQGMGPAVGGAMLKDSILAIVYGLIGIFIYLTFRYEVPFAIGGIVALSHDVLIAAGVCALCGREIGMIMVGALLTISGYSINDTIVIFDRIRDNLRTSKTDLATTMNEAISATLSRTILTSGVTLIVVIAMYFFGGPAMNDFSFAMLVGILIGTYSSIFVASPLVLWWATKRKLNLQQAILDADQFKAEAMSGIEKEAPQSALE